jgi:hypothetical protein
MRPFTIKLGDAMTLVVRCGTCHGVTGQHYPSSRARTTPRLCRACEGPVEAPGRAFFCETCRRQRCPECGRYAGQHRLRCLFDHRQRRPRLLTYHGLVRPEEILLIYLAHGDQAARRAARIVGPTVAEDCVQDAVTYLLSKRDYLTHFGVGYFYQVVKNFARRHRRYGWSKYLVAMDPDDLLFAEQAMEGKRRGRSVAGRVRVPEPDGW